ncbi:MAG: exopolyphosphatase/guanosine-5'-triphosphate,3'-diphosphate pyrophosphatase [Rhodothermales bacterium]|jgi:exopolyphosphatase/guanosine-5'-triphosphate,3'-diphosphate pyrophosphatase
MAKRIEKRPVAVIDIGSSAIRIAIAEVTGAGKWRDLDRAELPVSLGHEVFQDGRIGRDSIRNSIHALNRFRELLGTWQVADNDVRVIATSALREARNRDTFIDRVALRTGFNVRVIDGIEANHLTYLAVADALKSGWPKFRRSSSIIIEVGGGSTETMLLRGGKMLAAHTLSIGTVRIDQQVRATVGSRAYLADFMHESHAAAFETLNAEMQMRRLRHFIAVGGDARLVAALIGQVASEHHSVIERQAFIDFVQEMEQLETAEIVRRLDITYSDAEALLPALLVYLAFLKETSAKTLLVPDVSIREGVLIDISHGGRGGIRRKLRNQVIASALNLGRKFRFGERHGVHVASVCIQLFDALVDEHGLGDHERLLLEVAAILHEIGQFVSQSGHHKHSEYLISNSEIFGLDSEDIAIISNVARYHRKALPVKTHGNFARLAREHRLVVLKLAGILRVADALDRSHAARITRFTVELCEDEMILHCDIDGDISVERFSMHRKSDLFEQVFGLRVVVSR